jgi:hypothetical protein
MGKLSSRIRITASELVVMITTSRGGHLLRGESQGLRTASGHMQQVATSQLVGGCSVQVP